MKMMKQRHEVYCTLLMLAMCGRLVQSEYLVLPTHE